MPPEGQVEICSTGAKFVPAGVDGAMNLTVTDEQKEFLRAKIEWDSPHMKAMNKFV